VGGAVGLIKIILSEDFGKIGRDSALLKLGGIQKIGRDSALLKLGENLFHHWCCARTDKSFDSYEPAPRMCGRANIPEVAEPSARVGV
jgi:hypothetical protein